MKLQVVRPTAPPPPPTSSGRRLSQLVAELSFPRHRLAQPEANRRASELVADRLSDLGYRVSISGPLRNVVALPRRVASTRGVGPTRRVGPTVLVGAHYDSVPETPGADDNASAVAALLETARIVDEAGVTFVAFNGEEDGLLGSTEFVARGRQRHGLQVSEMHSLEMLGFCSHEPGSQRKPAGLPIALPPAGLPIALPPAGDFIGLVSRGPGNAIVETVLSIAATQTPHLPVAGLTTSPALGRLLTHLMRSDHAPFWDAGIPALMWTDTAEFRNPHYHRPTDTPDTLDYGFLQSVTDLLIAYLSAGRRA